MPVETAADVAALSTKEKIKLMELLWRDLVRDPRSAPPAPAWHRIVLEHRERSLADGQTTFLDFDEAVSSIRKEIDLAQSSE